MSNGHYLKEIARGNTGRVRCRASRRRISSAVARWRYENSAHREPGEADAHLQGDALIVSSYTHSEYATSMGAVVEMLDATALLLRGTESEAVADARRLPQMDGFVRGERLLLEEGRRGTLSELPERPQEPGAERTVMYIRDVLAKREPVPPAIEAHVAQIMRVVAA